MAAQEKAESHARRKWWSLAAVCFGLFMALLDVTIVNVALPAIQSDLQTSFTSLEWVVNAYTLVFAVALVTCSRLGDLFGRKTLFIAGLAIFAFGSLLCALSDDIVMLNVSRGVQGLGASAMMPLSLAIISDTFTGKQRGAAFGIWGGVSGLATGIGPLVGGVLVKYFSWQAIFYVNIPVGIVAVVLSLWAIRQSKDERAGKRIDLFGFVAFTVFMFCLIYGFIEVNEAGMGWSSPEIVGLFIVAAAALVVFILGELKREEPMIDPRLFRVPSFTGAAIAAFCLSAGMYALLFYLSLYLQNFLGFDALETGVRMIAFTALSLVFGPVAGALMGKFDPKWLIVIALTLLAVGVWSMSGISPADTAANWTVLLPGFVIAGIGSGLINPLISDVAVGTVASHRAGMASGVSNVARQMGSAFGIAFLGAMLSTGYTQKITETIADQGASQPWKEEWLQAIDAAGPIAGSKGLPGLERMEAFGTAENAAAVQELARGAFVESTSNVIAIAAVMLAIGAVLCLFLIRRKDLKY